MGRERFDFEDLEVFQRSLDLLEEADRFSGRFRGIRRGLGFHFFDAAVSVLLNIAESTGKTGLRDRARFLDIANGSAREAAAAVCAADRLRIGPSAERTRLRALILEIVAMLTTMSRKLRTRAQ